VVEGFGSMFIYMSDFRLLACKNVFAPKIPYSLLGRGRESMEYKWFKT